MGGKDAPIWASVPRPLVQRRRPGARITENLEVRLQVQSSPEKAPNECEQKVDDGDGSVASHAAAAAVAVAAFSCITTSTKEENDLPQPASQVPKMIGQLYGALPLSSDMAQADSQDNWPAVWRLVTDLAAGLDSCLEDFAALKASVIDCRAGVARVSNEQKISEAATQKIFRKALDTSESRLKREIAEAARVVLEHTSSREAAEREALYLKAAAIDDRLDDVRVSGASECHALAEATASLSEQLTSLSASCEAEHASLQLLRNHHEVDAVAITSLREDLDQCSEELRASEIRLCGLIAHQSDEIKEDQKARFRIEPACACYMCLHGREALQRMLAEHESSVQAQLAVVVSVMDGHSQESSAAREFVKQEIAELAESHSVHEAAVSDELRRMRDELRMRTEHAALESCSQSGAPDAAQPPCTISHARSWVDRCRTWRASPTDRNDFEVDADVQLPVSQMLAGWGVRGLVGAEDSIQSWG